MNASKKAPTEETPQSMLVARSILIGGVALITFLVAGIGLLGLLLVLNVHPVLVVAGLVNFACFAGVVYTMFEKNDTGWGVASALLFFFIGPVLAFFRGWYKSDEWGIVGLMWTWTIVAAVGLLGFIA